MVAKEAGERVASKGIGFEQSQIFFHDHLPVSEGRWQICSLRGDFQRDRWNRYPVKRRKEQQSLVIR